MKTAFNIKYRPEIEAGKFKVVTADDRPVTILRWNMKGSYPILACTMVKQCNWEGDESWDEERPFAYDKDGNAAGTVPAQKLELYLISEEPEMTEFEEAVQELIYRVIHKTYGTTKEEAQKLFVIASKKVEKDCGSVFRPGWFIDDMKEAKREGQEELLEEMPRWKTAEDSQKADEIKWLVIREKKVFASPYLMKGDNYLLIDDLAKLPTEEDIRLLKNA